MLKLSLKLMFCGLCVFLFILSAPNASADIATGTLVSAVFDAGLPTNFGIASWTASTTASSTLVVKIKTATTSDMSGTLDWASCDAVSNDTDISANNCVADGDNFIQYQLEFACDYTGTTTFAAPELYNLEIEYESVGALVSNVFDTSATDTVPDSVAWSESISGNADVRVRLRTSADGSVWTNWLGPTGEDDFYTDPAGGEAVNSTHSDGSGDRYFQYKIYFYSGGTDIPTLTDITVAYVVMAPVIISLTPDYADDNTATTTVTISGSDFVDGAVVSFVSWNKTYTASSTFVDGGEITAELPLPLVSGGYADVRVTNPNEAYSESEFWVKSQKGYFSQVNDLGSRVYFGTADYSATLPASTTLIVRVRSDDSLDMSGAANWDSCSALSSGSDISGDCVTDGHRYLEYRAELVSEFPAEYIATTSFASPSLDDITINYDYFPTSELISSPYDTEIINCAIESLSWSESLAEGTGIKFQIRTASASGTEPGTWTEWYGPSGSGTYYSAPAEEAGIYTALRDGSEGQWIQYKAVLESDGFYAPILNEIQIEYAPSKIKAKIWGDAKIWGNVKFR